MSGLQWAMAGVGALALLSGLLIFIMRIRTLVGGCKVDATVVEEKVEVSRSKSGKEMRVSTPVFEFTHDGKTYRCRSTFGTSTRSFPRGSKVKVRYLASDPASSAEIDSFMAFYGFPLVALVVGAAFIWIAVLAK